MKNLAILAVFCMLATFVFSQERSAQRITTYTVYLNALKHQHQVDGIKNSVSEIPHVVSCELNWIDYELIFVVEEGSDHGNFPMERLKAIVQENNAQLVKFEKEIKK